MNRREMLIAGAGLLGTGLTGWRVSAEPAATFEVSYSDAEWKARLSPEAYRILRKAGTERAFTSALLHEKRRGVFTCAGCALPVYASSAKYDSGTGWPSFVRAIPGSTATRIDTSFFMKRIEVHCRRCGGHLGHILDDGPPPVGKRHCINGDALAFVAARAKAA